MFGHYKRCCGDHPWTYITWNTQDGGLKDIFPEVGLKIKAVGILNFPLLLDCFPVRWPQFTRPPAPSGGCEASLFKRFLLSLCTSRPHPQVLTVRCRQPRYQPWPAYLQASPLPAKLPLAHLLWCPRQRPEHIPMSS